LTISGREQSLVDDVRQIRHHPLVPFGNRIYGYVYGVRSGRIDEVAPASEAGLPF
jgi:carbonic anhydrase